MLSVLALVLGATPADASTGNGSITGSGQISPGLTAAIEPHAVTFVGSGAGVFTPEGPATLSCEYSGASQGSVSMSLGAGGARCRGSVVTGGTLDMQCSIAYQRAGTAVTVDGECVGSPSGDLAASCELTPTSAPTVTTFDLSCDFVLS